MATYLDPNTVFQQGFELIGDCCFLVPVTLLMSKFVKHNKNKKIFEG
jgi:hypothetical protein